MPSNFRTYNVALEFYRAASAMQLPGHLRNQLLRAASSIALNLREGAAKPTRPDRDRFYFISMGSLRECQAILDLSSRVPSDLVELADKLGAHLYRLLHSPKA